MNFNGIGKLVVIVFVALGVWATIPALFSSLFATRPLWAVGIAALCGAICAQDLLPR